MTHVELHNHTHYSILDGASTPEEYMSRANELGLEYLAITDHGTTAGHRDFQREAKKAGIKPILGVEAYITEDRFDRRTKAKRQDGTSIYSHITLLAQNEVGLKNLEHMQQVAWSEGYYYKPRIDLPLLEEYGEGLVALSGCMGGLVAKAILNNAPELAVANTLRMREIFGERFFIEVMEGNETSLNRALMDLAAKYGIDPVVTSDCHMARSTDLPLTEAMLILQSGPKQRRSDDIDLSHVAKLHALDAYNYLYPERQMSYQDLELWLHSYEEHVANLAKHGIDGAPVENTNKIAAMIGDYPYYEKLDTLPKMGDDAMEVLRKRTHEGLKMRGIDTPENRKRVKMELDTIEQLNLADYFLIECDLCDYADDNDILRGYGRGSAVSYLSNYALGITKIDPMPYNLLPERFLSADRDDPADIDTDFAIDGRYEVKAYANRTYDHVSNIATITKYGDKSAIKAAAKVFKAPFGETNKLLNQITSIEEFEAQEADAFKNYMTKYPAVIPMAKKMEGRIQSFGMHAGGIILSEKPIEDVVPVQTANDPSDPAAGRVPVAALDMRELAEIGFVKYDLLGLRTLSIVDDTMKLVKERHGVDIDIEKIPLDDQAVYDMISAGHTAGLFQAEASASTKTILDMGGVSNFAELVASNALVRPGAANSTVGETYITGKKTGAIKKMHPSIDPVLEETFGAVLYQEQQLLLCEYVAGMSKNDSNKVRKAISKKILADLEVWKEAFIEGATKNVGARAAEAIWKDLEASADYAFAKAHAVGYSMLTLLTAYLKHYYPIEFLVSALNRMDKGNKTDRMKMLRYLIEAKRLGIRVRLPHVNRSGVKHAIKSDDEGDFIQMGLSQIKYLAEKTANPIVANAPYTNYADLQERAGVGARAFDAMNKVGAAYFGDNPLTGNERENHFAYLSLPSFETKGIPPKMFAQFRSLTDFTDDETFICMGIVGGDKKGFGWRLIDIVDETGVAGAFTTDGDNIEVGQVYVFLISKNSVVKWVTTTEIAEGKAEQQDFLDFLNADAYDELTTGFAKVLSFRSRKTRKGDNMADVVFHDDQKEMITALVWPSMYAMAHTKCKEGSTVEVTFTEIEGGYAVETIDGKR